MEPGLIIIAAPKDFVYVRAFYVYRTYIFMLNRTDLEICMKD